VTANSVTRLLVSVCSGAEATAALDGGADVIDVKEPGRGPLGRADDVVIADVLRYVAGRRPVSAALGEFSEDAGLPNTHGLSYVKWGLAGWAGSPGWRKALAGMLTRTAWPASPQVVLVAYADWKTAAAPAAAEVLELATEHPGSVLLLDTHEKASRPSGANAPTLIDLLTLEELVRLCCHCHSMQVKVALAGSLGKEQIPRVLEARPDWIAVRAAACRGGRGGVVCAQQVRELARMVQGAP
jgi:uncharacterized protein (UPF0264 family)